MKGKVTLVRYFDREGRPIDLYTWMSLMSGDTVVKQENVGSYRVSTVWVGLDPSGRDGLPLIFETMVFREDEETDPGHFGLRHLDCWRWTTEEQARQGHEEIVTLAHASLEG